MDNEITNQDNNKILIYTSDDGQVKIEVRLEDENVWLTQNAMAELFDTTRNNITMHIKNIFEEGELKENSVSKESLLTAKDGKNYKTKFYNLDLIISVGYRVKSIRGTQFRIWANKLIKEYLIKGYNLNVDRFKNKGDFMENLSANTKLEIAVEILAAKITICLREGKAIEDDEMQRLSYERDEMYRGNMNVIDKIINVYGPEIKQNYANV